MTRQTPISDAKVLGLAVVLLLAASSLVSSNEPSHAFPGWGRPAGVTLSHGPLVGAVTDVSVRIWARAGGTPPQTFSMAIEYGEVGDPIGTTSSAVTLSENEDFTGTVELSDLAATTEHWFRILLDGVVQAGSEGTFATLPTAGTPSAFRFAFGSCNDHLEMPYPIFPTIAQEDPAFFLHIGDIIYADRPPAATTQAEFEDRYKLNFDESNWRLLMAQIPSFMIWDDHEIENDWAGGQTGLYLEARPAFDEYVAGHNPEPRVAGELYYDFRVGNVEFFVLDTRSFRDPGAETMLGAIQQAELESWLSSSSAKFKFIVSSVQWSFIAQNDDTWFGFQTERAEIFDYVRDHAVPGVVLLSGDRHWMGVFRHEEVAPFFLYELSSSPLGAAVGQAPPPDPETLFLDDTGRSFMTIDVDATVSPATLDVRVLNESGAELYSLSLTEDDISPINIFSDGFDSGDTSAWSQTVP